MISTETSLLIRLRDRDDSAAWERFVKLYSPLVCYWSRQLVGDVHQALDVTQDILLTVLTHIPVITRQPLGSFRGWLRTITLNRARDFLRRQRHSASPELYANLDAVTEDHTKQLTKLEYQQFLARTALKLMRDFFSPQTFEACWRSVALGESTTSIAASLGISENAVYLARGRVLSRLREELAGLWEE